jgi:hypothetical protein
MRGLGRMLMTAVGDSLMARPDTVGLKKRIVENREKVQEIGNPLLQEMLRKDGISQERIDAMRGMLGRQLGAQEDSLYQERIKPAVAAGWKGRGGNWTYESPDSVDTPQGRRPRVRQTLTGVIPLSAEHRDLENMGARMEEENALPLDERIRRMRERMAARRNP